MAALPGFTTVSPTQVSDFTAISNGLNQYGVDYFPFYNSDLGQVIGSSDAGVPPVAAVTRNLSGFTGHRFLDDFYYRIHLQPNPVALGNLLSSQTIDVDVWNAWFDARLLSSITPVNDDGMVMTAPQPAPTTFAALESRIYQLAVSTTGPAVIDGSYSFNFPAEVPVLAVTGNRVTVWPFQPNWEQPMLEQLGWLTDVMPSYGGTEQRVELRSFPRRELSYEITPHQLDQQRMASILFDWQARVFALPIWMDVGFTQVDVAVDDLVVAVNTDDLDYHPGGLAVIYSDSGSFETVEIDSLTSIALTLKRPLQNAWPANTRIYPARTARMQPKQRVNGLTPSLADGVFTFLIIDNDNVTAVESATLYRALPVLELRPKAQRGTGADYQRMLSVTDYDVGIQTVDDASGKPIIIRDYYWVEKGRSAIAALRAWLFARKGRLSPIWIPTWRMDMTLVADVVANALSIDIAPMGYTRFLTNAINRRDIRVQLTDGSVFYRRITAAADNNTYETLTINADFGVLIAPADIVMISFVELHRLNSDAIEFSWPTINLVLCRHQIRTLTDDV